MTYCFQGHFSLENFQICEHEISQCPFITFYIYLQSIWFFPFYTWHWWFLFSPSLSTPLTILAMSLFVLLKFSKKLTLLYFIFYSCLIVYLFFILLSWGQSTVPFLGSWLGVRSVIFQSFFFSEGRERGSVHGLGHAMGRGRVGTQLIFSHLSQTFSFFLHMYLELFIPQSILWCIMQFSLLFFSLSFCSKYLLLSMWFLPWVIVNLKCVAFLFIFLSLSTQ
jgi:hypothetical protein